MTVQRLASKKLDNILKCIKNIVSAYSRQGLKIKVAQMDKEVDPLKGELALLGTDLNPTAASEHMPEIERGNRVVKERSRAIHSTLPFPMIPNLMVEELVIFAVLWLNTFPPITGVLQTLSPCVIFTGTSLNLKKHYCIPFGAYTQTHDKGSNTMDKCTLGAIVLGLVGNTQSSYKFMSLHTGRLIVCHDFDELPVTEEVIVQVKCFVDAQKQPNMLEFCDHNQVPIPDNVAELEVYHDQLTTVDNDDNDGSNSANDNSGGSNDSDSGNDSSGGSGNNSSGGSNDYSNDSSYSGINSSGDSNANEPNEQDVCHTDVDTTENNSSHGTATHGTNLKTHNTTDATTIILHNDNTSMAQPVIEDNSAETLHNDVDNNKLFESKAADAGTEPTQQEDDVTPKVNNCNAGSKVSWVDRVQGNNSDDSVLPTLGCGVAAAFRAAQAQLD
eukprot:15364497-Ditylum_brightwellii.AAC.4